MSSKPVTAVLKILSWHGKIHIGGKPYIQETCIERKPVFWHILLSWVSWVIFLLQGYQDLTNHYQKRLRDPGKIVYETKSDSMQLYSIFAKRMVISQDKKDSTSMSWDDQEYELSVTSNKRRLNGKSKNLHCMFLSCHVRVSELIHLYSCLNVKELIARSRREIWTLSDCNWTRSQNHLIRKQRSTIWQNGWVFVYELSGSGFESSCSHLRTYSFMIK